MDVITDFVSPLPRVSQVYSDFWKYGALILALVATFASTFTRIKLFIIRLRSIKRSSSKHLLQCFDDNDFDFSDLDDDTSSSVSEFDTGEISDSASLSDGDQFEDDFRRTPAEWSDRSADSQLRQRGSAFDLFSWSDFAAGKSVVKLWDSLGLGIDFQDSSESEFSIWDLDRDQKINAILDGKRSKSSPAVIYLSEPRDGDGFVLGAYDGRMGNKIRAVYGEWGPQPGNVVRRGRERRLVNNGGVERCQDWVK